MTEMEAAALASVRPALLARATDGELSWLAKKLDQWRARAAGNGGDPAEVEVAAGFVVQAAAERGAALPDGLGVVEAARDRCTLAERLELLPDEIVLDEDHVELMRAEDGTLHVFGGFGSGVSREDMVSVLASVGVPASPALEQFEDGATYAPVYDLTLRRASPLAKRDDAPVYVSKAEAHRGGMVAIPAPPQLHAALQAAGLPVTVAPEALHVTLLYLGPTDALSERARAAVAHQVEQVAAEYPPLRLEVTGAGRFAAGDDGVPVVALVSAVGLSQLQADLERAVGAVVGLPSRHGWVPHLTLGYVPDASDVQVPAVDAALEPSWTADSVRVVLADEVAAELPLAGRAPAIKAAWDAEPPSGPQLTRIACAAEKQIVYYVVSEPDTVDAHGHRIKAQDVEDALHGYMAGKREVKLEHDKSLRGKAVVVEGFIAPQELTEFHGATPPDGPISKGSSIVGIHYTDAALWRELRDAEHGISWGGYARRVER